MIFPFSYYVGQNTKMGWPVWPCQLATHVTCPKVQHDTSEWKMQIKPRNIEQNYQYLLVKPEGSISFENQNMEYNCLSF